MLQWISLIINGHTPFYWFWRFCSESASLLLCWICLKCGLDMAGTLQAFHAEYCLWGSDWLKLLTRLVARNPLTDPADQRDGEILAVYSMVCCNIKCGGNRKTSVSPHHQLSPAGWQHICEREGLRKRGWGAPRHQPHRWPATEPSAQWLAWPPVGRSSSRTSGTWSKPVEDMQCLTEELKSWSE